MNRLGIFTALGLASVVFFAGIGIGYFRSGGPPGEAQSRVVRQLIENADGVDTLAVGDSITEQTWLGNVCGITFNAAQSGFKVTDVREVLGFALPRLKPRTVIVAVGANHFRTDGDVGHFRKQYDQLLGELPRVRIILVGVPNNEDGNRVVQQAARRIGAAYVPPMTGADTTDGVHLTSQGARSYRQRLERACATA